MDDLFTIQKWEAWIFVVMGWALVVFGFYVVGMGVYHAIHGRWELSIITAFSLPLVWGLAGLCAWAASHKEK